MKKLIYGSFFLALVGIGFSGCKKEEDRIIQSKDFTEFVNEKSLTIIDENNVGYYHNEAIIFLFEDLSTYSDSLIGVKLKSTNYISEILNEYCRLNNINLPDREIINRWFAVYDSLSISDVTTNVVFSSNQQEILKSCFTSLSMVDTDFSKANQLISFLDSNLKEIKGQPSSTGRTISIAVINQLIASTQLWIIDGKIDFLDKHHFYDKAKKPTPGQVLGADGKGLATSLLFSGGWTSPIGWCGSMFVGAGASIGKYIDSNWWPY